MVYKKSSLEFSTNFGIAELTFIAFKRNQSEMKSTVMLPYKKCDTKNQYFS